MQDTARLRSINMGQLATATDRMLMFGQRRKSALSHPPSHRPREAQPRRAPRRSLLSVVVLAVMFGVVSLIAVGVGTTHASTISAPRTP